MRCRIGGLGLCWVWDAGLVRDVVAVLGEVVRGAEVAHGEAVQDEQARDAQGLRCEAVQGELVRDAQGLQCEAGQGAVVHADGARHWKVASFVSSRSR